MRYADIPADVPLSTVLHCPDCDGAFSATVGDYFMADPNELITCGVCGSGEVRLAQRRGEHFTPIGQISDADIVTKLIGIVRRAETVRSSQRVPIAYAAIEALLKRSGKL
jgi:hypothetical protein